MKSLDRALASLDLQLLSLFLSLPWTFYFHQKEKRNLDGGGLQDFPSVDKEIPLLLLFALTIIKCDINGRLMAQDDSAFGKLN